MLREISVENLAVIDGARLELRGRMTAITGETGAGKSLVVDAIGLALGDRADTQAVRSGAERAAVTAVFDPPDEPAVRTALDEAGVEPGGDGLFLSREISTAGRSQSRINGRPSPAGGARLVGEALVDLQGQHEHQALLSAAAQRDMLDDWIGEKAKALRRTLAETASALRAARERRERLEERSRERERLIDLHRFELKEIEEAGLSEGEDDRLAGARARMVNAERLSERIAQAADRLIRSEGCTADTLSEAQEALERATAFDDSLNPLVDSLRTAAALVEETGAALANYADQLEFEPAKLEEIAERLDLINRLKRKYGDTVPAILEYARRAGKQLAELEAGEEALSGLRQEEERLRGALHARCADLSKLRKQGAARFAKEALRHIRELAMEHARFQVRIDPKEPDGTGAEDVEFLFSANPGHPERPLRRVASGGELSRVMLALRCVLAGSCPAQTLVFDEVDAGLGGETASVVGRKLRELSRHNQVIVITHLPQIAGQADEQFRVDKSTEGGTTRVTVERLDAEERVRELARMLGGASAPALEHAREILAGYSPVS